MRIARDLAVGLRKPPGAVACILAYYSLLIAYGSIANPEPIKGVLAVLTVTHFFVVSTIFGMGGLAAIVAVWVPVSIALCFVWLTGWWRAISVLAVLISANLYGIYSAVHVAA